MQDARETYVDYLARCQQAFRPFAPIDLPEFFQGRRQHVETLSSELATAGRQVAIYGERGVGKTSLARLAYFYANFDDDKTYLVRCESSSTYETIFGQILLQGGTEYLPNGMETETERSGGVGLGPASASRGRRSRAQQRAIEPARQIGPAALLKRFADQRGLLIVDEYDRITDASTHTRVAETLKHFSDAASQTKIMIVGVAETLSQLIGEHQSLTRSLAQIRLGRMTDDELSDILKTGEERIGLRFHEAVRRRVVALSDGFPFYTHLLCKYAAEEGGRVLLENPRARVVVSTPEYRKAIRRAIETAEGTLYTDYQAAVITVKRKTDMFQSVLWGAAYSEPVEVQVRDIAENVALLTGAKPKIQSVSACLAKLVSAERRNILVRARQGYYKFSNPLMRAYIRLILEEYNILHADGQLLFPWMRAPKVLP